MAIDSSRLVAGIAKALKTAGIKFVLPGHKILDSERSASWVEINPMRFSKGSREKLSRGFVNLSCFSTNIDSAFSHLVLAESCLTALGDKVVLYDTTGLIKVGVALLSNRPNLQTVKQENEYLFCSLDLDYNFVT